MSVAVPPAIGYIVRALHGTSSSILYKSVADRQRSARANAPLITQGTSALECIEVSRTRDNATTILEVPTDLYQWVLDHPENNYICDVEYGVLEINGAEHNVPTMTLYKGSFGFTTFVIQQPLFLFLTS